MAAAPEQSSEDFAPSAEAQEAADAAAAEDDMMLAPPPDVSVLARTPVAAPSAPMASTLNFRQTMIPPLLTAGVLSLIGGTLHFVFDSDSVFAATPIWMSLVLYAFGLALLGLGIIMMLSVKNELERTKPGSRTGESGGR